MTGRAVHRAHSRPLPDGPAPFTTLVELTFQKQKIEHWIRFGRKITNRSSTVAAVSSASRRTASSPSSAGRRASTARSSRASTSCARARRGEPFQTLPFVRPGGDILLKLEGWRQVERVLQAIDAIERLGIDPAAVSPDHWRHVHNRMTAGREPRAYTPDQHRAYLLRRRSSHDALWLDCHDRALRRWASAIPASRRCRSS